MNGQEPKHLPGNPFAQSAEPPKKHLPGNPFAQPEGEGGFKGYFNRKMSEDPIASGIWQAGRSVAAAVPAAASTLARWTGADEASENLGDMAQWVKGDVDTTAEAVGDVVGTGAALLAPFGAAAGVVGKIPMVAKAGKWGNLVATALSGAPVDYAIGASSEQMSMTPLLQDLAEKVGADRAAKMLEEAESDPNKRGTIDAVLGVGAFATITGLVGGIGRTAHAMRGTEASAIRRTPNVMASQDAALKELGSRVGPDEAIRMATIEDALRSGRTTTPSFGAKPVDVAYDSGHRMPTHAEEVIAAAERKRLPGRRGPMGELVERGPLTNAKTEGARMADEAAQAADVRALPRPRGDIVERGPLSTPQTRASELVLQRIAQAETPRLPTRQAPLADPIPGRGWAQTTESGTSARARLSREGVTRTRRPGGKPKDLTPPDVNRGGAEPARDLFGEAQPDVVKQGELLGGPSLAEQGGGARETIARLKSSVDAGTAKAADLERYLEALRMTNQTGKRTREEIGVAARLNKIKKAQDSYEANAANKMIASMELEGKGSPTRLMWEGGEVKGGAVGTGAGSNQRGRITQAEKYKTRNVAALEGAGVEVKNEVSAVLNIMRREARDPFRGQKGDMAKSRFPLEVLEELPAAEKMADDALLTEMRRLEDTLRPDDVSGGLKYVMLDGIAMERGLKPRPGHISAELIHAMQRGTIGAALGAPAGAYLEEDNRLGGAVRGAAWGAATMMGGPAVVRKGLDVASAGSELFRRGIDVTEPLSEAFESLMGGSQQMRHMTTQARRSGRMASQYIRDTFEPIAERIKPIHNEVREVAQAERVLELQRVGDRKRATLAAATTTAERAAARETARTAKEIDPARLAEAQATVAKYANNAEVQQGAADLRKYYRDLLEMKLNEGVITREDFDRIIADGDYYIPLLAEGSEGGSRGKGRLVPVKGVRRLKGTRIADEFEDPFTQMWLDTQETFKQVTKQRVSNLLGKAIEANPGAAKAMGIEDVPLFKAKGKGQVVQAHVNGEQRAYEFGKEAQGLWDAWAGFDEKIDNIAFRILAPAKRILQAGATLMPDFMVANMIRDAQQAAVQFPFFIKRMAGSQLAGGTVGAMTSENKGEGFVKGALFGTGAAIIGPQLIRSMNAVRLIANNDPLYKQWLRDGGAFSEFYSRPAAAKQMRKMFGERSFLDTILAPVGWGKTLGRIAEESTRLSRYKYMLEQGATRPEALFHSADVSLDFTRVGKDVNGYASTVAFLRPKILGWEKLYRMAKDPRTAAMSVAAMTAPTVGLWMVNKDLPEYWDRPLWEKSVFWLVPKGRNDEGEMQFWRIPKPFELGFMFASIPERFLDYAYNKDPEALVAGLADITKTSTEGSLPIPTAIEPLLESKSGERGTNWFTNREIVDYSTARLPETMQVNEQTSNAARLIEKILPGEQSPVKVDHFLRAITGGMGREVMALTDRAARGLGLDKRDAPTSQRIPLVSRFVSNPNVQGELEAQTRRRFKRATAYRVAAEEMVERGDEAGATTYIRKHAEYFRDLDDLKEKISDLDKVAAARRTLRDRRDMTTNQRKKVEAVLRQLIRERLAK